MGRAARRKRIYREQYASTNASTDADRYLLQHERDLRGLLLAVLFSAFIIYLAGSSAFGYVDSLITSSALDKNSVHTSGVVLAVYSTQRPRGRWVRYQFTAPDRDNVKRTFTRRQEIRSYNELLAVQQQATNLPIIYVPGDPRRSSVADLNYWMTPMQFFLQPINFCIELGVLGLIGWAIAHDVKSILKSRRASHTAHTPLP